MALIEFKNVNKYYGDYHALRDINLEIEKGQVVVLLGPSGSGKSTLIRTINALESIDNGTLIVNGHNVTEASAKDLVELRKEAGMVFQHFNLYPHKTVLEQEPISLKLFVQVSRRFLKVKPKRLCLKGLPMPIPCVSLSCLKLFVLSCHHLPTKWLT